MRVPASTWAASLVQRALMYAARRLLGAQQADWARAMLAELSALPEGRASLAFAWGCFTAALGHALSTASVALSRVHNGGLMACSLTVLVGCGFMRVAGAPSHYVWMNLASLVFAVATFRLLPLQRLQTDTRLRAELSAAMGALLLLVSLGKAAATASGWVHLSSIPMNLTWMLLPAILVGTEVPARSPADASALAGVGMAVGALALQADPVMLTLVAAVLSHRAWRRRHPSLALLALASWGIAAQFSREWQPPEALRFVDQVLHTGFDHGPAVGLILAFLQALPLWPALRHRQARRHGLVWGLMMALSLPGWLPSMFLGFGGSFIVGYLLSLGLIGDESAEQPNARPQPPAEQSRSQSPPLHRSSLT